LRRPLKPARDRGAVCRFIRQEPLQAEREEPVDLSLVCEEVVAMTQPLWAERSRGGMIHLERDLADVAVIRGIAGELREALLNLVQNALDAMEGGGTLGMRTRVAADAVHLEISDSGIGMSAGERAFEPFFTTRKAGTGLRAPRCTGCEASPQSPKSNRRQVRNDDSPSPLKAAPEVTESQLCDPCS
jgi:signal transduction histidine kinase